MLERTKRIFLVEEKVNGKWQPQLPSQNSRTFGGTNVVIATTSESEATLLINSANEEAGIFRLAEYEFKRVHDGN